MGLIQCLRVHICGVKRSICLVLFGFLLVNECESPALIVFRGGLHSNGLGIVLFGSVVFVFRVKSLGTLVISVLA